MLGLGCAIDIIDERWFFPEKVKQAHSVSPLNNTRLVLSFSCLFNHTPKRVNFKLIPAIKQMMFTVFL